MRVNDLKYLVALSALVPSSWVTESIMAQKQAQPNVVFILIDDLSFFGVGAYGAKDVTSSQGHFENAKISTPNIDKLAKEGVRCDNAYVCALSEPTRISLMTGMNLGRNFLEPKALHDSQITFSDVFKHAGYATGMYGKWKQTRGTNEIAPKDYISAFGWDDYVCFDVVTERQRYINPDLVVNGNLTTYRGNTDVDPMTGRRYYGPDIYNYNALRFIEENQDKPFFLYYPMVLIHDEHRATPDTKPNTEFDTQPEDHNYDKREYYPDMISYADKLVGKVVQKLDDLKLRDNTLVIVMGDNGSKEFVTFRMQDGTLHQGAKGHTRYGGEQVPLIFSQPGTIPQGEVYKPVVDVTDLYPTMMEGAQVPILNADKIDGVSFWSQIVGKDKKPHRDCLYKWYNSNRKQDNMELVVRYAYTADYKYYAPHDQYPEGRFFNLIEYPLEHAGQKGRKMGWENYWYSGKDMSQLNKEELKALKRLKAEVDKYEFTEVSDLKIINAPKNIKQGETAQLSHKVLPANATRCNVVWESSNPKIASINKFGELIAHKKGEVTINLYSWDDAWPVANGAKTGGYKKDGIKKTFQIQIL